MSEAPRDGVLWFELAPRSPYHALHLQPHARLTRRPPAYYTPLTLPPPLNSLGFFDYHYFFVAWGVPLRSRILPPRLWTTVPRTSTETPAMAALTGCPNLGAHCWQDQLAQAPTKEKKAYDYIWHQLSHGECWIILFRYSLWEPLHWTRSHYM